MSAEGPLRETENARRPPAPTPPEVGPFDRAFWRSPLRSEWLTSFLGSMMLPLLVIGGLTGFLSHFAYNPGLGSNDVSGGFESGLYFFSWPTGPAWLYSVTQGLHTLVGLAAVPLLIAKLWSVIPKLFEVPSARSLAHVLERLSVATLVGSSIFLLVTGVLDIQYWYPFSFAFVPAHYYAAIVFIAALCLHVALKLPIVGRAFRREGTFRPLGEGLEMMRRPDPAVDSLAAPNPADPTLSRRGLVGLAGGGALGLIALNVGTNLITPLRGTALLSPRGQDYGSGPTDFQINKTAASVGVKMEQINADWQLSLIVGDKTTRLGREDLLAMPLATQRLPIDCVEGWSTWQTWTGVPIAELAKAAGAPESSNVLVESVQEGGAFRQATLSAGQVADSRSLLALKVNGADLSVDHGFPARVIVPALPGVHNTKWVGKMTFMEA